MSCNDSPATSPGWGTRRESCSSEQRLRSQATARCCRRNPIFYVNRFACADCPKLAVRPGGGPEDSRGTARPCPEVWAPQAPHSFLNTAAKECRHDARPSRRPDLTRPRLFTDQPDSLMRPLFETSSGEVRHHPKELKPHAYALPDTSTASRRLRTSVVRSIMRWLRSSCEPLLRLLRTRHHLTRPFASIGAKTLSTAGAAVALALVWQAHRKGL